MDDVLIIWNYGEPQIEGFLGHLNNLGDFWNGSKRILSFINLSRVFGT